jgi:anti-sigma-K factor RskA
LLALNGPGKEAKLSYSDNVLTENRNSMLIDFQVEPAGGTPSGAPQLPWP